jgi:hypothetical protein
MRDAEDLTPKDGHSTDAAITYVLGVPRSGTTLLAYLLAQHPNILCLSEPWLMLALESLGFVPANHPSDAGHIRLATGILLGQSRTAILGRAAQMIYRDLLSRSSKQLIIDKTPRYYHCLPFIREAIPHARFIWIRRNPLDVAASYKSTWNLDIAEMLAECRDVPHFYDFALGFRRLADFADTNDVCVISYEDLVKRPQDELGRVFRYLNLPVHGTGDFDPNSIYQQGQFGDQKIFRTRAVHSASVDNYRSILSFAEIETIMKSLGRTLFDRLGYKSDYDQAVHEARAYIVDRSEVTYRKALHLVAKRVSWYEDDPVALTNLLKASEGERVALANALQPETAIAMPDCGPSNSEAGRAPVQKSLGEVGVLKDCACVALGNSTSLTHINIHDEVTMINRIGAGRTEWLRVQNAAEYQLALLTGDLAGAIGWASRTAGVPIEGDAYPRLLRSEGGS